MESQHTERLIVLEQVVRGHDEVLSEIRDTTKSIAESIAKLAALEEKHSNTKSDVERAFKEIDATKKDLKTLDDKVDTILDDKIIPMIATLSVMRWALYITGTIGASIGVLALHDIWKLLGGS